MNNFERIDRVIRYLDGHHSEQPGLGQLAAQAGLSQFHFQRMFSAWAGVTPKQFLQCLTATHARQLLRDRGSVLDAALDAGLSGPGRLHDLCVKLEAASPGEIKSGGAGWTIEAGFAESPFGTCLTAETPRGICHLSFVDPGREKQAWAALQEEWPRARWNRSDTAATRIVREAFERDRNGTSPRTLRAFVKGTAFQLRVWRALIRIPEGAVTTYGRIAEAIGAPTAARAVGSAVGSNPVAFLIPCHRVIRETGVIGEYHWGAARKRSMIAWEGAAGTVSKTL